MSTFSCEVSGRSPLLLRLSTPVVDTGVVSSGAELQRWFAFGETYAGATSRPQIYRPSMPGIGLTGSQETAVITTPDRPGLVQPRCKVASVFQISPSLPFAAPTTGNLPFLAEQRWPKGRGIILLPVRPNGSFLLSENCVALYALGNGTHTWTGSMSWEEI